MPKLIVIYDPMGNLSYQLPIDMPAHVRPKAAEMHVADDLDGVDIYELARKLAEMLLEQIG